MSSQKSVSQVCRETGYQNCFECEDIVCGDNMTSAGVLAKAVRRWVESLKDAPTYGSQACLADIRYAWGKLETERLARDLGTTFGERGLDKPTDDD